MGGDQRGLGIVEHDTFFRVEQAWRLVDARDDRFDPERQDVVAQQSGSRVEHLPLPCENVDEFGKRRAEGRPGCNDCGAFASPSGTGPASWR